MSMSATPDVLIDPITLRVLGGTFTAIAKEMAHVIFRTASFTLIREGEDLGTALMDADGREIAESETTSMHCGSIGGYVRGILGVHGDNIHPGDMFFHNNPYMGGTHTPDVSVCIPVFHEERLVGWVGNTAHVADIGGATPGFTPDAFDIYAEGKLYNALRLYDRGVRNEELWRHILENVRTPASNRGDIEALIASSQLGQRRFLALFERYGSDVVLGAAYRWMDYCETMMRREIAKAPDGEYVAPVQYLDDDGKNRGEMLNVNVKVVIAGDEITIDLTGSHDQVETAFNAAFEGATQVAARSITRIIFLDQALFPQFLPHNEGVFRPVKVVAPEGSIFNPTFPRGCIARFMQCNLLNDSVYLALAEAIPERAVAGSAAEVHVIALAGLDEETSEYWVYIGLVEGCWGGRYKKDGMDAIGCLMENVRNSPVEDDEWRYPIRHERYELRPIPPGAGRWRGGLGVIRRTRFLTPGWISQEAERQLSRPQGIFGGLDGHAASTKVFRDGELIEELPSKYSGHKMEAGDVIEIETACGAGYGSPLERDAEQVFDDVLDDLMDREHAAEVYGVEITPEGIDQAQTARLRAELAARRA